MVKALINLCILSLPKYLSETLFISEMESIPLESAYKQVVRRRQHSDPRAVLDLHTFPSFSNE